MFWLFKFFLEMFDFWKHSLRIGNIAGADHQLSFETFLKYNLAFQEEHKYSLFFNFVFVKHFSNIIRG